MYIRPFQVNKITTSQLAKYHGQKRYLQEGVKSIRIVYLQANNYGKDAKSSA